MNAQEKVPKTYVKTDTISGGAERQAASKPLQSQPMTTHLDKDPNTQNEPVLHFLKMKVEVWSDIMCPFCYLGKRKFENALAQFPGKEQIEVE